MLPYTQRWLQIKEAIGSAGMDLAILTSPASIFYLTGFYSDPHERFMALVIQPDREGYTLFVPALDEESARAAAQTERIIAVNDTDNPFALLERETARGASVIGVESASLRYSDYVGMAAIYPGADFRDASPLVMSLRLYKTEDEIERVQAAVGIAESVLASVVSKAAVGVTELELNAEIEYRLRVLGGDKPAFETIVLGGVRTALPHGRSSAYKLQENDLLLIDMGVYKDGYCSDITRTFLIGEGTEAQQRIYQSVLEANLSAIAAVKAGRPLAEVDRAARSTIAGYGYDRYFTHRTGHGMGIDVHEQPSVHGENSTHMQRGLLFTIEPGVYIPDIGGVRIEDDIYIGPDGEPVVLTSYPKELTRL